jgi:hypothetical protein
MNPLDIFQKLPGGTRLWICGAGSIQEAKARLLDLQKTEPAEYYACDLIEKTVVVATTRERPELHTVADETEFFGRSRDRQTNWRPRVTFQDRRTGGQQLSLASR